MTDDGLALPADGHVHSEWSWDPWGVGGTALTFGSDAHAPTELARGLGPAAALAEAYGFRPGSDPTQVWSCRS
ncbi:MAG TPA: hypothetical protein VF661_03685 [Actinomycetales bacterium]